MINILLEANCCRLQGAGKFTEVYRFLLKNEENELQCFAVKRVRNNFPAEYLTVSSHDNRHSSRFIYDMSIVGGVYFLQYLLKTTNKLSFWKAPTIVSARFLCLSPFGVVIDCGRPVDPPHNQVSREKMFPVMFRIVLILLRRSAVWLTIWSTGSSATSPYRCRCCWTWQSRSLRRCFTWFDQLLVMND